MRRVLGWALTAVVAVAGVIAVLVILSGRDKASVSSADRGPGKLEPDRGDRHLRAPAKVRNATHPPTSGAHVVVPMPARDGGRLTDDVILSALERGNIVIAYPTARAPAPLRGVQRDVQQGPYSRQLAQEGQAVLLGRYPTGGAYVALGWRRMVRARAPDDPRLADFADRWLGVGAP